VRLEGTKEFDAPREVVWSVINDPSKMAKTMPGVESFEIADDTHWSAKVKVPLGLGGLKMSIAFTKLEERPLEFASLNAKGTGVGALMNMTTSFTLSGEGETTSMGCRSSTSRSGTSSPRSTPRCRKRRRQAERRRAIGEPRSPALTFAAQ
jgi:carbon monoxide dehydrogenase subunit G